MVRPSHLVAGLAGALFATAWEGGDAVLWWLAAGASTLAVWCNMWEAR